MYTVTAYRSLEQKSRRRCAWQSDYPTEDMAMAEARYIEAQGMLYTVRALTVDDCEVVPVVVADNLSR